MADSQDLPAHLIDPERHKKRVELALSISNKIRQFALKHRGSFHTESKEEKEKRIVVGFVIGV